MRLFAVVFALAAAQTTAPTQTPPDTASLKARVVAADTGTPLRLASATITGPGTLKWIAPTDDDGRFALENLPAGPYVVRVAKPGFVTWTFGRDPGGSRSRVNPIEMRVGEKVDLGELRVPRSGAISGRVLDDHGDPAVGFSVSALRFEYREPGERIFGSFSTVVADDRGVFRLFGLDPGTYFIGVGMYNAAAAPSGFIGDRTTPPPRVIRVERGVSPTFYPGTAVGSDATPVVVGAGQEIAGINVTVLAVPFATLSGTVFDSRGQPATGLLVMANPARTDDAQVVFPGITNVDSNGDFLLVNLPPGDYRVDVLSRARTTSSPRVYTEMEINARVGADLDEFASVPVTVAGRNIDSLIVRTTGGFELEGRVTGDAGTVLPRDSMERLTVDAQPLIPGRGVSSNFLQARARVQADGRFSMKRLIGTQVFRVNGLPRGWVMKSVRLLGADVSDEGFEVQRDIRGLEVVVTSTPTTVSGTVQDSAGKSERDYGAVIVFSTDARRWTMRLTRYVVSAKPDTDGQFVMTGLPPGAYYAAVVDTLEPDWPSPDSLEALRKTAVTFSITDGESKSLVLVRRQ